MHIYADEKKNNLFLYVSKKIYFCKLVTRLAFRSSGALFHLFDEN